MPSSSDAVPGSFTGLRTACSVAQGLAFGAGVPVLPVDTLMAVAEDAHWRAGVTQVVAVLDARMDEVYWAHYARDPGRWTRQGGFALGRPESVVIPPQWALAGNACSAYGERWPEAVRIAALPTAAALLRLAPALLADGQGVPAAAALPLYIRDKVAQTTEERAACGGALPDHERCFQSCRSPIRAHDRGPAGRGRPHRAPGLSASLDAAATSPIRCDRATRRSCWWPTASCSATFVAMKGVDEVHLLNITVAPEHQGQGLGRLMLDALALWSRGQQAQWLWLEVRASNARAQRIYEQHGYRRVGERKSYYPAGGRREDAVVMSLKL